MTEPKIGFMCSTDFEYELGEANGGNVVYPSAENCIANCICLMETPTEKYDCYPQRVAVMDATKLESERADLAKLTSGLRELAEKWKLEAESFSGYTYKRTMREKKLKKCADELLALLSEATKEPHVQPK